MVLIFSLFAKRTKSDLSLCIKIGSEWVYFCRMDYVIENSIKEGDANNYFIDTVIFEP